jgi:hypothetical protein
MKKLVILILALCAASYAQTAHSVTLTWTNSVSACVTRTLVHRVQTSGTEAIGTNFATVLTPTATFVDTTVVAGQTYYYTVSAYGGSCGGGGESAMSAEITAVIPTDPPAPPTGLTGTVR